MTAQEDPAPHWTSVIMTAVPSTATATASICNPPCTHVRSVMPLDVLRWATCTVMKHWVEFGSVQKFPEISARCSGTSNGLCRMHCRLCSQAGSALCALLEGKAYSAGWQQV